MTKKSDELPHPSVKQIKTLRIDYRSDDYDKTTSNGRYARLKRDWLRFVVLLCSTNKFVCRSATKTKRCRILDISLLRCSGGRWGCCSLLKILTTSIYRPFQPLFFTIWSHIGLILVNMLLMILMFIEYILSF